MARECPTLASALNQPGENWGNVAHPPLTTVAQASNRFSHSHSNPRPRLANRQTAQSISACEVTPVVLFLNPDPIACLVGQSNKAPVIVDGQRVTTLIDSGSQVSSISSGFCEQMALMIHPLDQLLELEGTVCSTIPYLGYVEVNLQIPGVRGYNEDVLLLVILTTINSEKVPVMVGSKSINRAMRMIMKGELVRASVTWKQAHFGAVMSGLLQLSHKGTEGDGVLKGSCSLCGPNPPMPKESCLDDVQDMSIQHGRSPSIHLELLTSRARQMSEETVCGSMCWLSQHKALNCPLLLYWLPHIKSYTPVPPECWFVWGTWVPAL